METIFWSNKLEHRFGSGLIRDAFTDWNCSLKVRADFWVNNFVKSTSSRKLPVTSSDQNL